MLMKKVILLLLVYLSSFSQFSDNFSDGDFTTNPAWTGETSRFIVNALQQLQSNGISATDTIYLTTQNTFIDQTGTTEWNFWVKLDFSPSSSNYARVYLISDTANLQAPVKGYFVQIGGITGNNDAIDLYRQDGNSTTKIIAGIPGHAGKSVNILRIRVLRDNAGNWQLFADTLGNNNFLLEGTANDNTYSTTKFFGVYCKHTSTRAQKFYFDDFYVGPEIKDTIPPKITKVNIINNTTIRISFSEGVQNASATNPGNYSITPAITITNITAISTQEYEITFASQFQDQTTYALTYSNIQDYAGNAGNGNVSFTYYTPKIPNFREIRINEIMADPTPAVGLPATEYIELFNNSTKTFPLANFKITDKKDTAVITDGVLYPGEYVIVCNYSDTSMFNLLGKTIGVSSLPALNNSGDSLEFLAYDNTIVDYAYYNTSWYHDPNKDNGGWSLELIDPDNLCDSPENWAASVNSAGGTPGQKNSVFKLTIDSLPPEISQVIILSNTQIQISFDEVIDTSTLGNNILISPGNITPMTIIPLNNNKQDFEFLLSAPLDSNKIYTLKIWNVKDCPGNIADTLIYKFAIPLKPQPKDVIINEILFDPLSGHKRYVEIYNNSDKILNIKNWLLAKGIDSVEYYRKITDKDFLLFPKQYLCLTDDTTDVKNVYSPPFYANFLETKDNVPSYPANEGKVWLFFNDTTLSDAVHYLDDWHFPDLKSKEGVALERICFNCESQNPQHWTSASSANNYGTPGYKNSQFIETEANITGEEVFLENTLFSPDNDGYQDHLVIHYKFPEGPSKLRILIYDRTGRRVRYFTEPILAGTEEGTIYWDGRDDNNSLLPIGAYVVVVERTYNNKTKLYKLPCILGKRNN